jgi:hypothetical protein
MNDEIEATCPACSRTKKICREWLGRKIQCPCGNEFLLEYPAVKKSEVEKGSVEEKQSKKLDENMIVVGAPPSMRGRIHPKSLRGSPVWACFREAETFTCRHKRRLRRAENLLFILVEQETIRAVVLAYRQPVSASVGSRSRRGRWLRC